MNLALQIELKYVVWQLKVYLANVCQLVSGVLQDVELCAEKTVDGVFALLHTVASRNLAILYCSCDIYTLCHVSNVNTAQHFPQHGLRWFLILRGVTYDSAL